jgi:hypothetical protein
MTGALVSPSGTQPTLSTPWSIANGGTGAATKSAAQLALGLGQNSTFKITGLDSGGASLAQNVTTSTTTITGTTLVVPATGLYLVSGYAIVDFAGATIGTSAETLTLSINDTTAVTTVTSVVRNVPILTTITYPSINWAVAALTATLTSGDTLALQMLFSQNHAGNPTAGTIKISSAGLIITPLALS